MAGRPCKKESEYSEGYKKQVDRRRRKALGLIPPNTRGRKNINVALGEKMNCRKCDKEIVVTEYMLRWRRFWCYKCCNAHNRGWKSKVNNKTKKNQDAYLKYYWALKIGKLKRGVCKKCGSTEKTHGHHEDYSKPLDVVWLCPPCHRELHRQKRKNVTLQDFLK